MVRITHCARDDLPKKKGGGGVRPLPEWFDTYCIFGPFLHKSCTSCPDWGVRVRQWPKENFFWGRSSQRFVEKVNMTYLCHCRWGERAKLQQRKFSQMGRHQRVANLFSNPEWLYLNMVVWRRYVGRWKCYLDISWPYLVIFHFAVYW